MKIDLHCHTKYSNDNCLEPERLIQDAIRRDLDGVCITEHNSLLPSGVLAEIEIPEGFHVFRGVEISTDHGHLLVYGLKEYSWKLWSRNRSLNLFDVIEGVHEFGAVCAAAHPYRSVESFGDEVLWIEGFDAIETHNGLNPEEANRKARAAAAGRKLPMIGGSDCHHRGEAGRSFTVFQYPVQTMDELVEEIKVGRCEGMSFDGLSSEELLRESSF